MSRCSTRAAGYFHTNTNTGSEYYAPFITSMTSRLRNTFPVLERTSNSGTQSCLVQFDNNNNNPFNVYSLFKVLKDTLHVTLIN